MVELQMEDILALIRASTFPDHKAAQIRQISAQILEDFDGELPAQPEVLTRFKGVGPKCAHLALGVALGYPCISVDIHVHRGDQPVGVCADENPRENDGCPGGPVTQALLGRNQSTAGTVWQAHLPGQPPQMPQLPAATHVCAGGGRRELTLVLLGQAIELGEFFGSHLPSQGTGILASLTTIFLPPELAKRCPGR